MEPVEKVSWPRSDHNSRPEAADQFIIEIADNARNNAPPSFAIGQIDQIAIPKNWKQNPATFESAAGSFTSFKSDKAEDATLCFYSRGGAIDETAAKAFRGVLDKPAHRLSAEELTSLSTVMRERIPGQNFKVTQAGTQDIDGRKVLFVEGQHTNADLNVVAVYIDAAGDGRNVQEVYYQAPSASYLLGRPQAMESFRSMRLKDNAFLTKLDLAPF